MRQSLWNLHRHSMGIKYYFFIIVECIEKWWIISNASRGFFQASQSRPESSLITMLCLDSMTSEFHNCNFEYFHVGLSKIYEIFFDYMRSNGIYTLEMDCHDRTHSKAFGATTFYMARFSTKALSIRNSINVGEKSVDSGSRDRVGSSLRT